MPVLVSMITHVILTSVTSPEAVICRLEYLPPPGKFNVPVGFCVMSGSVSQEMVIFGLVSVVSQVKTTDWPVVTFCDIGA